MPKNNVITSDFEGFDDPVELFKAGSQTDSKGITRNFTNNDLDDMVANHDSFPIVIGHPKVDDPAYGWSNELTRVGDSLFGKFNNVEPQFAGMVENKRFPNRSVRIKQTPDGFKIAHVGFLGATPPAIEGLKQIEFNAEDDGMEFEFSGYAETVMARMLRRMREFMIDKFSIEEADKVLPEFELEILTEEAVRERLEDKEDTLFNKHPENNGGTNVPKTYTQEQMDAALDKQKSDFSSSETDLKIQLTTERTNRLTSEYAAFVNEQVDGGKLTPAMAAGAVDFMLKLPGDIEFEFSQGEGENKKQTKTDPVAWFKDFVGGLGKSVSLGAIEDDDIDGVVHEFDAPTGSVVDTDRLQLHNKANDYMQKHDCDYVEALVAIGA